MPFGCVRYSALDLGASLVTYASSAVNWVSDEPAQTAIVVSTSLDGESFTQVANGGPIAGLSNGDPLAGVIVTVQAQLQTLNSLLTPTLRSLEVVVVAQEAALRGPDDWYNEGQVFWLTGANAGRAMEIKDWDAASRTLTLNLKMPRAIAVEDTFEVFPGCTKRLVEDCIGKFANGVNFIGEPFVPGQDQLLRFPDAQTPGQ